MSFRPFQMLAFLLIAMPCLALAASIDELKDLVKSEQYEKAYALASSISDENAGDAQFDYLYGVAARRTGHPEVAIFAFERVLMQDAGNADCAYERGLALLEVNDLLSAQFEFESVLKLETSEQLKMNATRLLEMTRAKLEKQEKPTQFHMEVAADVGYNSNVNSSAIEADVALGQAPPVKDGFANLGVAALIKRKTSKEDAFFFSLASNNRKNFRAPNWDYNTITARTGLELGFGQFQLRPVAEFEALFNNYEIVRVMPSLGAVLAWEWDPDNVSDLSLIVRHKGYIDPTNNHLSFLMSLQHESHFSKTVDMFGEVFYAPGFAYGALLGPVVKSEAGLNGLLSFEFVPSQFVIPSFQLTYRRYPVSAVPSTPRDDVTILTQLSYEWHPCDSWSVGPSFIYVYNYSTDALQSYMRYQVQLGVRYLL